MTKGGLQELFSRVLSLAPSQDKKKKVKMIRKYVSPEDSCLQPLPYIARSDDTKLLDEFIRILYEGKWRNIPDKILSSTLYEAIQLNSYEMVKHILKNTEGMRVNWEVCACDNPRLALTEMDNIRFLNNTEVAELVRKTLRVSKYEFALWAAESLKTIRYILDADNPSPHPDLEEARKEWSQKAKDRPKL